MKNALTSVALALSLGLSWCSLAHQKYTRRVNASLAETDSPGRDLAEAIKYLSAQYEAELAQQSK